MLSVKRTYFMENFDSYMDFLEVPLKWSIKSSWIYKLLAMFIVLGFAIMGVLFVKEIGRQYAEVMMSVALCGLGIFTYSMNRPAAGHRTMDIFLITGVSLLLYKTTKGIYKQINVGEFSISLIMRLTMIMFTSFMTFCFCFIFNGDANWSLRSYESKRFVCDMGAYDYESFKNFAKSIGESIPENTWAVGKGTTAIYMELGWDRQAYSSSQRSEIESVTAKGVFISSNYEKLIPEGYSVKQTFTYRYGDAEYEFEYLTKN